MFYDGATLPCPGMANGASARTGIGNGGRRLVFFTVRGYFPYTMKSKAVLQIL